jgi:rhodanese-related sulfurtransferase
METLSLVLSILSLLIALGAWLRAGAQAQRIEDLEAEVRRRSRTLSEETDEKLNLLKEQLVRVNEGKSLSADMIREGRLWRDVLPEEGKALLAAGALHVIDVRTVDETRSGMLPGAVHIPVSELEARFEELPRDDRPKLVYCAGGGRSAAACEFLAREGFVELSNLAGGISAWTGPVERP